MVVEPVASFESTLTATLWREGFEVTRHVTLEAGIAEAGLSKPLVVSAGADPESALDEIEGAVRDGRILASMIVLVGPAGATDAMTRAISCGLGAYLPGKSATDQLPWMLSRLRPVLVPKTAAASGYSFR